MKKKMTFSKKAVGDPKDGTVADKIEDLRNSRSNKSKSKGKMKK